MPQSAHTDAYAQAIAALVALRKERGLSQVELARRLGKPQQFVSLIERRERRLDIIEFYAIVRALGADPATIAASVFEELPATVKI